jgi:hypothetical protein
VVLLHPGRAMEFGWRFKSERERLKLVHADLTAKTGVGRFSIGRFERGDRGIDSDALLSLLYALADEGANLDYIVLGRTSAAKVALAESSAEALATLIAAKLQPPAQRRAK